MAAATIQSVIERLSKTNKPAKSLDGAIAELVGWTKLVSMTVKPGSDKKERTVSWRSPEGSAHEDPPAYTSDLQTAYDLVVSIEQNCVGAVSLDGAATFETGEKAFAASPTIALCMAGLKRLRVVSGRE